MLVLFSFQHPYDVNVGLLEVVLRLLILSSFFWTLLSSSSSVWLFFASLGSKLLIGFLASSTPLLFPCKLFFISVSDSLVSKEFFFFLKILFIYFTEQGGRKRERETSMCGYLLRPSLGTQPATQACVLTGNRTGDPLVQKPALNPLNHTSQS